MPRLTTRSYLSFNHALREMWLHSSAVYGMVSAKQQWELHDYFVPAKALSNKELLAHRQRVSCDRPSLPQQAGRTLTAFERGMAAYIEEESRAAPARRQI